MLTEIQIEIKGLKEVQRKLEQVASSLADGDLLARGGLVIERRAKMNATGRPGPQVQTGRLRASITVEVDSSKPATWARVGTNVEYAPPLEFGHTQQVGRFVPAYALGMRGKGAERGLVVTKGLGVRLVKPFAPAYPFLTPAVEQAQTSGELDSAMTTFGSRLEEEWSA